MTEPTQAQIEVALKEYQNPKYDAADDETIIKAVLTAAAGVCPLCGKTNANCTGCDDTAAAGVGDWCEQGHGKLVPADTIRADTIECCARVVEEIGDKFYFREIAAAIRALKDKPL